MFCIKCGKTLDPSTTVCPDCGTKVVLPEGFDLQNETATMLDIDMLIGEKTVSADHSAIARKAAAATSEQANDTPATTKPAEPAPVAEPSVPHSPTGFDLNGAKKIMNGRSILIDDSPTPGSMPVYTAAAPASAPVTANNNPDNKKLLIALIAAIVAIAVIAGILLFVFLGKDKDKEKGSDREDITLPTISETERATEESEEESTHNTIGELLDITEEDEENITEPYEEKITRRPLGGEKGDTETSTAPVPTAPPEVSKEDYSDNKSPFLPTNLDQNGEHDIVINQPPKPPVSQEKNPPIENEEEEDEKKENIIIDPENDKSE